MTTSDLIAHEHGLGCVCGPVAIPIAPGDGSARFHLVGHRRLDGLPSVAHREDAPAPVRRAAPRMVNSHDGQRWLVMAIFAVAALFGLAFM
jgi:hypothetical protein